MKNWTKQFIIKNKLNKLSLLVILFIFVGSILRGWSFWTHNFNGDEAAHMRKAVSVARGIADLIKYPGQKSALQNIYFTILQHNHPPLEFLLLIPAVPFENRELFARLIYLSINILFLPLIYLLIQKILNRKLATIFLLLFSTSMYSIWTSQIVTHDSISIIVGTLIGLTMIYFIKNPNKKSFYYLALSISLGLFTTIEFFLFFPVLLLLVYKFKRKLDLLKVLKTTFIFMFILSIFYLPYIIYSQLPDSPSTAGFNYYLNSKLSVGLTLNGLIRNFISTVPRYYQDFFVKSGVFPVWIFAILSIFKNRNKYIKYLFLVILTFLIFNLIKFTTSYFYMAFYGLLLLLGSEWLAGIKNIYFRNILLIIIVMINFYGSIPLIKEDFRKTYVPIYSRGDNLKRVGKIAKVCLEGNESYISTVNPWRTFYYFGRPVLPAVEGSNALYTPSEAAKRYSNGDLRNEVFLIHYQKDEFPDSLSESLRKIAEKEYVINKDIILLFKPCSYRI